MRVSTWNLTALQWQDPFRSRACRDIPALSLSFSVFHVSDSTAILLTAVRAVLSIHQDCVLSSSNNSAIVLCFLRQLPSSEASRKSVA